MVLVTTFLLLRELHNWLTRYGESEKQYRLSEKEKLAKLRAKYKKLDNTNNNTLRWLSMKSNPTTELSLGDDVTLVEQEETELHKELSSVRAVLEMREEELRKLRWKLDRSQVNCDVKHIQTQTDDCSASAKKPKTFDDVDALFDGHVAVVQQNQYGSDLGQRGCPDGGELNQEDTGKAGEVTCLLTNKVLLENQDTSVPPIKKHKDVDDLSAKYSRIDRMASRFVF